MSGLQRILGRLFKSGATKDDEPEAPVVRAYGKLPMYIEYRRLECGGATAAAFSRWIDEGYHQWAQWVDSSQRGHISPQHLWIEIADAKEQIVGCLWDSTDSGGRRFPFCLFVTVPESRLGKTLIGRFGQVVGLWEAIDSLHQELAQLSRGQEFNRLYRDRRIKLVEEPELDGQAVVRDAQEVSYHEWIRALTRGMGAGHEPPGPAELAQRIATWHDQLAAGDGLAVRCRLASGFRPESQVLAWIQWLTTHLDLGDHTLSVVWGGDSENGTGSVVLLARPMWTDDFKLLTPQAGRYEYADELWPAPLEGMTETDAAEGEPPAARPALSLWTWAGQPISEPLGAAANPPADDAGAASVDGAAGVESRQVAGEVSPSGEDEAEVSEGDRT